MYLCNIASTKYIFALLTASLCNLFPRSIIFNSIKIPYISVPIFPNSKLVRFTFSSSENCYVQITYSNKPFTHRNLLTSSLRGKHIWCLKPKVSIKECINLVARLCTASNGHLDTIFYAEPCILYDLLLYRTFLVNESQYFICTILKFFTAMLGKF